jgi:hypothetical protein
MQAQGAVEVRARRCRSATHDVASGFSAPSEAARATRFQSRVSGNATQPPFSRTDKTERCFSSPFGDASSAGRAVPPRSRFSSRFLTGAREGNTRSPNAHLTQHTFLYESLNGR